MISQQLTIALLWFYYNYHNLFLDDTPILKKFPDNSSVLYFIKCHSARWDEFASELQVTFDKRESLRHDINLDDRGRLERVVISWIESQHSPVTWQKILKTLVSMDLMTTAGIVQDCLKRQHVFNKSQSKQLYATKITYWYFFVLYCNIQLLQIVMNYMYIIHIFIVSLIRQFFCENCIFLFWIKK